MLTECTLFDDPHHLSLELLASQALVSGDIVSAFRFADRRCRVAPDPESYCYLLRSEALFQKSDKTAAIADLLRAKYLAPENIAVNRRILARTTGSSKREAALALIRHDLDANILLTAIAALRALDRRHVANAVIYEEVIEGWAVWQSDAALDVTVTDGSNTLSMSVVSDPFHPLSNLGKAANFELRRPKSSVAQSITMSVGDEIIYSTRTPANERWRNDEVRTRTINHPSSHARSVAIVIPVFANFEATRRCIESVLSAQNETYVRVVLVNDASPDSRIATYLKKCAKHQSVLLLENEINLGYVGSINRALKSVESDDVLLLNSDTIVPHKVVDRLMRAAISEANNGEYMSFPVANTVNPLGSQDDIAATDAVAAEANAGRIVDIPNGIGFCMYITRACLDAVGVLSEDYDRGYLEDADFCLRARTRGFRNVCDPSIFVGHAGTKSFGAGKRALVMRNLDVLERRFPAYAAQSDAFVLADPLRPSREAIERASSLPAASARLIITGAGVISAVAQERANRLKFANKASIILEFHYDGRGPWAKVFNPAGGVPQSLQYMLVSPSEAAALVDYVRAMRPTAIEIFDPTRVPISVVERLLELGIPHDIFVADGAFLGARSLPTAAAEAIRQARIGGAFTGPIDATGRNLSTRWLEIARTAGRIIVPSEQAGACALSNFDASRLLRVRYPGGIARRRGRRRAKPVTRLGFLSVRACGEEHALIAAIVRAIYLVKPEVEIIVVGVTSDDLALMRIGQTFVTGPVEPKDVNWVAKSYRLQAIFLPLTRPIFGHPLADCAFASPLPVAYFDWSVRRARLRGGDLALNPQARFDEMIASLRRWLSSQRHNA
jgi:GT2 family glycosyltransferase